MIKNSFQRAKGDLGNNPLKPDPSFFLRDDRKELLEEMRERLETKEGHQKYIKRLYTVKPIFGHLKHNLGYQHFLMRGFEKVKAEFRLMCIGYNLKKMNQLLAEVR